MGRCRSAGIRVAVLGPSAADTRRLYGDYSYPGRSIHIGADQVVEEVVATTDLRRIAAGADAREALSERYEVVDVVDGADVAVVFVGGRSGMSERTLRGILRREATCGWLPSTRPHRGDCGHRVCQRSSSSSADVRTRSPKSWARRGARDGVASRRRGRARGLVDVLAGDVDAGVACRCPCCARSARSAHAGHHHGGGRSLIYGDYIDGPVSPLFAFGHGLSYTSWSYDEVAVVADRLLRRRSST